MLRLINNHVGANKTICDIIAHWQIAKMKNTTTTTTVPRTSGVVVKSPFYTRLECDAFTEYFGIMHSGRQNDKPTDVYILMPSTCEYAVTGQNGIVVADGIEVANQLP